MLQQLVHKLWYQGHWLAWLLLPLSALFWLLSALRRLMFKLGLKRQQHLPVPVIVVGNITAGGSGKTPTVLYLIALLKREGWRPGVISRGYGANIEGVQQVCAGMSPGLVGDEPAMIASRTSVPMVVGANRIDAARKLLELHDVNVIVCDDGLQHYQLARDIEILLIDGQRRFGNGLLLPAGPLREGQWRKHQVDFILCNGGSAAQGEYPMTLSATGLYAVAGNDGIDNAAASLSAPKPPAVGDSINAMAGIGNPARFFDSLCALGYELASTQEYADHMAYCAEDIARFDTGLPLLMTEKDAVKCREFAKQHWWYLAVDANLPPQFSIQLLDKLTRAANAKQGTSHGL